MTIVEAPSSTPARSWTATLKSNWPIPLVLVLLVPLQYLLQHVLDAYQFRILMLIGINVILAVSLQLINGIAGQFSLGHAGFMAVGAYLAAYPAITWAPHMDDPLPVLAFYLVLLLMLALAGLIVGTVFFLIGRSRWLHPSLPMWLLLILAAWFIADVAAGAKVNGQYLLFSRLIALLDFVFLKLLAWATHLAAGMGHVVPAAARSPLTFLILLVGGGICAAIAGLAVGLPTLRLRGDYLAIATLGFAEIIRIVIINSQPLGGALGLTDVPLYTNFAWLFGAALLTTVVVWRIAHSAAGRSFKAVREDEIAAAAMGVHITQYKVLAFVIGAFFAGVAGALAAHFEGQISTRNFDFLRSVELVVIVVLAGSGSITGTVVAAALLTWLPEQLRELAQWRMAAYAVILIVMMILRPEGLLGTRELWWKPRHLRQTKE